MSIEVRSGIKWLKIVGDCTTRWVRLRDIQSVQTDTNPSAHHGFIRHTYLCLKGGAVIELDEVEWEAVKVALELP